MEIEVPLIFRLGVNLTVVAVIAILLIVTFVPLK